MKSLKNLCVYIFEVPTHLDILSKEIVRIWAVGAYKR